MNTSTKNFIATKHFVAMASLVGAFTSAHAAWAKLPDVRVENSASCPAQLAEFKLALSMDSKIVKTMPTTANGDALVVIQSPQKEVNPILRSSGYGLASWELSPTFDEKGNCVPVKAAEIVESVHQWNHPLPLTVAGFLNCPHQIGEILDAQSKRPDLFAPMASIGRPTSDTRLKALLSPNGELTRVFPSSEIIDVIPNVEENGKCKPVQSKELISTLDALKKQIEQKAEYSALGVNQEKTGSPTGNAQDTLDSQVAGVKVFVGNMQLKQTND